MTSPSSGRKFTRHEIMLGAGNLRFDRELRAGWEIEPSIGIVAKDVMRMALGLESMREPLKRSITTVMIPSFRKNFDRGGRPDKWEALAEYTLQVKGLAGVSGGDKPLIRSGALRRAVGLMGIWDIGNTSATIRKLPENVWYGAIHQAGHGGAVGKPVITFNRPATIAELKAALGGQSKGHIPQRQFILFQEEDIDDIQQVFFEWLVEQTILLGRFAK